MKSLFSKIRTFFLARQQYVAPLLLLGGFVIDWFTLNRIDQVFDNLIFIIHLLLSGGAIAFLHATDERFFQDHPHRLKYRRWAAFLMLFSLGALYSGFFIFYLRSSSLLTSWIIVFGLLGIMLSTEWYKSVYENQSVQVGIYYLAVLCYAIFVVPILMNDLGAGIFVLSGVISLLVITGFILILRKIDRDLMGEHRAGMLAGIAGIFVVMNFLYFMNIIPPIPLSMKFRSPYLYVEKQIVDGAVTYQALYERTPWYNIIHNRSRTIAWTDGQPVYVFASVFAPSDIVTEIRHCWEYFDTTTEEWKPSTCIPITIAGGRSQGYRGFSRKGAVWPGRWRVQFVTERNQPIGMVYFKIEERTVNSTRLSAETL